MRSFFSLALLALCFFSSLLLAQEQTQKEKSDSLVEKEQEKENQEREKEQEKIDTELKANEQKEEVKIHRPIPSDYMFFRKNRQPKLLDEPICIESYYSHNYIRKDHFGFIPFPNLGQTLNPLIYVSSPSLVPDGGFSAKKFNYTPIEDVRYFDVKTPTTEFYYEGKTAMRKDPLVLNALFTHSPNQKLNYSIEYGMLRAPDKYPNEEALRKHFLGTISYSSPSRKYRLWTHYLNETIENTENWGMKDAKNYEDKVKNRFGEKNLEMRLGGASALSKSALSLERFYAQQSFQLVNLSKEAPQNNKGFFITHSFFYEPKEYSYEQKKEYEGFGKIFPKKKPIDERWEDKLEYTHLKNEVLFSLDSSKNFLIEAGLGYDRVNYEFSQVSSSLNLPKKIEEDTLSLLGNIECSPAKFLSLKLGGGYAIAQKSGGSFIFNTKGEFEFLKEFKLGVALQLSSVPPSLNSILYRSFYENLNYYHPNFKKIHTRTLSFDVKLSKHLSLSSNLHKIDNYTYFASDKKPAQYNKELKIFDIRLKSKLNFWKIGFENTLQYQRVEQAIQVLPLPSFVVRSSLYYEDLFFNNTLLFQSGFTLNYFSKFNSRELFPPLNEFVIEGKSLQEIGGYPFLDAFVNFSVFRMKFYIRALRFNSTFSNQNPFVSPGYPAKRFDFRIGILWRLFT